MNKQAYFYLKAEGETKRTLRGFVEGMTAQITSEQIGVKLMAQVNEVTGQDEIVIITIPGESLKGQPTSDHMPSYIGVITINEQNQIIFNQET